MEFCKECGRYLDENDDVCPECGLIIHPEAIVVCRYPYRWPLFVLSLVIAAVVAFVASYYLNAFFFFLLIPIVFFGRDPSRPITYVLSGVSFGVGIGLIAMWIYRYSGWF